MRIEDIDAVITSLREAYKGFQEPIVTVIAREKDPYKVLVSTVLSLRTKDAVTNTASLNLFKIANNIESLRDLDEITIQKAIYPVGFYKTKAKNLKKMAQIIVDKYNSKIPKEMDDLLSLPNVGRKTANLVLAKGYDIPAICVDIHVHRISNRLGLLKTKNPEETEFKLREILPEKYWIEYNDLVVPFGQNICKPVSPFCTRCPIYGFCDKVGVDKSR